MYKLFQASNRRNLNIFYWLNIIVLGLNFFWQQTPWLNTIAFVIFFIMTGIYAGVFFNRLLNLSPFKSLVFGYLVFIYWLSFTIAIFVNFYKYSNLFALLSVVFLALVFFWLGKSLTFSQQQVISAESDFSIRPPFYLTYALPLLFILGIVLLLSARTGDYIITPWQVIPKIFIYIFLLITFSIGVLIFSKLKTGFIIVLIVLHSYFLHAYLPIVYQTGFGGDKWRHLASEKYLASEQVYSPSLIGEPLKMMSIGPWQVPEVLLAGNKTSYGNQWGLTLLLSYFLNVNIFWIDYWLIYILWSFFIPLLLYQIAGFIYQSKQFRLLVAFLPTIFYTLQVFGAITIPVSLGFIYFLAVLYLWLYYIRNQDQRVRNIAILLSLLMYFSYVLYFIIILVMGVGFLLWGEIRKPKVRRYVLITWLILSCLVVPVLEIVMGYGAVKENILNPSVVFNQLADAFGTLTGVVAFIPRPTHIDQGNWLYNQTRQTQSQASLFNLRLLPLMFTGLIWLLALAGIEKIRKLADKKIAIFFLLSLVVMIVSYVFSWYFMEGNHILARRLDVTISFFWLVLIALGVFYLINDFLPKVDKFVKIYGLIIFISLVAASTYTSGPVLEVVTHDEIKAANFVWDNIDKNSPYCVVANTWPLLGLEYVSGREIIAGGFPVYLEYAQPERVKIFEGLIRKPKVDNWLAKAFAVTGARECWYMVEKKWMSDDVWQTNIELLGDPQEQIGKVYLWRFTQDSSD